MDGKCCCVEPGLGQPFDQPPGVCEAALEIPDERRNIEKARAGTAMIKIIARSDARMYSLLGWPPPGGIFVLPLSFSPDIKPVLELMNHSSKINPARNGVVIPSARV